MYGSHASLLQYTRAFPVTLGVCLLYDTGISFAIEMQTTYVVVFAINIFLW